MSKLHKYISLEVRELIKDRPFKMEILKLVNSSNSGGDGGGNGTVTEEYVNTTILEQKNKLPVTQITASDGDYTVLETDKVILIENDINSTIYLNRANYEEGQVFIIKGKLIDHDTIISIGGFGGSIDGNTSITLHDRDGINIIFINGHFYLI